MVEGLVSYETVVGLHDEGVVLVVVGTAVVLVSEGGCEGGHEGRADGEGDVAGCIEGAGDQGDGFFGEKEGVGILMGRGLVGHNLGKHF